MKNVFVLNAHEEYEFAKGELNRSLTQIALDHLKDAVLLQTPVNWMGLPWSFTKYMAFVYSFGMDGRMCKGDGRTRSDPNKQYGTGGKLSGTKYMLSLTLNAPQESFNDPSQTFFGGMSVDDLLKPMHLNFAFFDMEPLPTFACYDVMKNPDVENDLAKYREHLASVCPPRG